MDLRIAAAMVAWAGCAAAAAGEFNQKLSIGDKAPGWEKLAGVDGKRHSLADLADKEVVVVAFTCNSCPAARDYEDRMIAFAKKHAAADSKVAFVAINSNTIAADRLDKMQERAKEKNFPYAYLFDESQEVAKAFGAVFTPEFFVLDKNRKVVYMGALDDASDAARAKVHFVERAVQAAFDGKLASTTETLGRGCRIRFNKQRRS